MEKFTHRDYLGDAVYVAIENGMIRLTTEDGISINNVIYMEPSVIKTFLRYLIRIAPDMIFECISGS